MAQSQDGTRSDSGQSGEVDRRQFLGGVAAAGIGAGLSMPSPLWAQTATDGHKEKVNLAFVGVGRQGRILLNYALQHLDNVHFAALADIWSYSRKYGEGLCKRHQKEAPKVYDSHTEMLAKEKGNVDGVFVAVPDMHHAQVTNDCLRAGLNVYCEKEMSTSLEDAASMVRTARETGKLLQIGHQRRSNPFYHHSYDLIHEAGFVGDITNVYGQWHQLKRVRPVPKAMLDPKQYKIPSEVLKENGFADMAHFRFWRWFKETSGGPMADLGSHQVDIFNWFLNSMPKRISAVGGNEWGKKSAKSKPEADYEPTQLDHTLVTYQYETEFGPVDGLYSVILSSSKGGFYEDFLGDKGAITTAEIVDQAGMHKEAEAQALAWEDKVETAKTEGGNEKYVLNPARSLKAGEGNSEKVEELQKVMKIAKKAPHLPHERNFVEAIRGNEKLNCPADPIGYETAVTSLKAHEAAISGKTVELKEADFKV